MQKNQPPQIAFFGTSDFAAIILERLINSPYRPSLVVTQPDKSAGRKQKLTLPPVKILTQKHNVQVIQPEKLESETAYKLKTTHYSLFIVAAYGAIIAKEILDIPKHGSLNVHPSLLPRWRGPSPIQYAILNGDKEMGVTIMLLDEELDHGPILSQKKFLVSSESVSEVLLKQFAEIGANMLIDTIPKWINGEITPKWQEHKKATYSKKISKEDGRIDWSKSALEIDRQVRAFTPWPGTFTFFDDRRIKIISGHANSPSFEASAEDTGKVLSNDTGLTVQTGSGVFIIEKLQPEGRNTMFAKQFVSGYPQVIGSKL